MTRVILIAAAVTVVAGVVWVIAGRRITLLADAVWTRRVDHRRITAMTYSTGSIHIGKQFLETRVDFQPRVADGKLALTGLGRGFVLGSARAAGGGDYEVTPDAGDEAALTVSQSILAWPTPLDLNFMTGVSPSWKRHRYYVLSWKKSGGQTLRATWRYERWKYSGGWGGDMNSRNPTGLISVKVSGQ